MNIKYSDWPRWPETTLDPSGELPLHAQIREHIRNRILSGELPPNEAIPPERILVDLFGVSNISVRRAMLDLAKEGLVRRTPGRGSFVQSPQDPDKPIGVIVPDGGHLLPQVFVASMLFGISQAISERNRTLMFYTTEGVAYLKDALNHRFAGVLIAGLNVPQWEIFLQAEIPFVLFGEANRKDVFTVDINNEKIGYDQTWHLIQQGATRIGFLGGGPHDSFLWQDRHRGYARALQEAGLPIDTSLEVVSEFTIEDGARHAREMLNLQTDGLVCVDDLVAQGAYLAASERQISIPEQLKIIGCNNSPALFTGGPPLSSIDLNPIEYGRQGARLLLNQLDAVETPKRIILDDHRLIERESSRAGVSAH
jgi:DNA-binding LacI/PurR family transcriptional regulator